MKWPLFVRFQILGWMVFILFTLPPKFEVQSTLPDVLGSVLVHDGVCIVLTLVMQPIYNRLYQIRQDTLWIGSAIVSVCGFGALIQLFLFYLVGDIFPAQERTLFRAVPGLGVFYYRFGVFLFWSLMFFLVKHSEEEGRIKLNMLRAQMNPHFLSHALGHVLVLIGQQIPKARVIVQSLANYLNYSLRHQKDNFVTLAEEYDALQEYLVLEKAFHGHQLDVACQLDASTQPLRVPGVILQPLMENAIKYGFLTWTPPVVVRLAIERTETHLQITVGNTGHWVVPDKDRTSGGIGLDNLRKRLRSLYGRRYQFETLAEEGWVIISIKIPI